MRFLIIPALVLMLVAPHYWYGPTTPDPRLITAAELLKSDIQNQADAHTPSGHAPWSTAPPNTLSFHSVATATLSIADQPPTTSMLDREQILKWEQDRPTSNIVHHTSRPFAQSVVGKAALARHLQRSLKAAHCYRAKIDGDWGPASKRAMRQFMNTINATLPVSEPTEVLLRLITIHPHQSCRTRTIVAKRKHPNVDNKKRPGTGVRAAVITPPTTLATATRQGTHNRSLLAGRMSLGAPLSAAKPRTSNAPRVIVYPAAKTRVKKVKTIRKKRPRRINRRRARSVYQTDWARQAFGEN